MKIPVLESLFNKVAVLRPATLLRRDSNTDASCEIWEILKNTFFYRTPLLAASYYIETSPLICTANQWIGFYMSSRKWGYLGQFPVQA